MACLLATAGAIWAIARRQGQGGALAAIWVFLLASANEFANLGRTQMIEGQMVPRMVAMAGVLWAIPLLLRRWRWSAVAAGAIMGFTGLVQGAPSLQMMPIIIVWLTLWLGPRRGLVQAGMLLAGFAAAYWPQWLLVGDVVAEMHAFSDDQVIAYAARLRHPHHMLPLAFAPRDYLSTGILLLLLLGWARDGAIARRHRPMLKLLASILLFLLGSVLFIYGIPIAQWIEFQPFRVFASFRILLYFFMALHLLSLLRSKEPLDAMRGVLLLFTFYKGEGRSEVLNVLLAAEAAILFLRPHLQAGMVRWVLGLLPALCLLMWLPYGPKRTLALIGLWALMAALPGVVNAGRAAAAWLGGRGWFPFAGAGAGLVLLTAMLILPFEGWEKPIGKWTRGTRLHYQFTQRFQVYPYPSFSLEHAANWANYNTPLDALFIIPPGLASESFHIWSGRSVVFNVKLYPFLKAEWPEWLNRYRIMAGVLDPVRKEDLEVVLEDPGAESIKRWYLELSGRSLARIARHFKAQYVVSPAEELLRADELIKVAGPFHNLGDSIENRRGEPMYVFEVRADVDAAPIAPLNPAYIAANYPAQLPRSAPE